MRKKIINISILISIVTILFAAIIGNTLEEVIYTILFILIIDAVQLVKNIFKINYKVLTIFQVIACMIGLYYGYTYFIFLITILLFDLLYEKVAVYTNIIISIGILLMLKISEINMENIINLSLCIILINLYLYEISNIIKKDDEYKKLNKSSKNNKLSMERKIIELEKYLEQNNIMTSLKERNFIAQKLHDHLGHRITSSLMQLEVTKEMIGKDDEMSRRYLVNAMDNLKEGMDEIRNFLSSVKPRQAVVGIETIKEMLMKFQYASGIETLFLCEGDISSIKIGQLSIVEENIKEALTNAAKYSNATKINVSIYIYNKFYRVEVRDNGCGSKDLIKGLGLRGIEERLEVINGRVEYYNDDGFVVSMVIKKEV